jgi:hypothetical protein
LADGNRIKHILGVKAVTVLSRFPISLFSGWPILFIEKNTGVNTAKNYLPDLRRKVLFKEY